MSHFIKILSDVLFALQHFDTRVTANLSTVVDSQEQLWPWQCNSSCHSHYILLDGDFSCRLLVIFVFGPAGHWFNCDIWTSSRSARRRSVKGHKMRPTPQWADRNYLCAGVHQRLRRNKVQIMNVLTVCFIPMSVASALSLRLVHAWQWPYYFAAQFCNTLHNCSRHGVVWPLFFTT